MLPVPHGPPFEIVHSPLRRTTETAEVLGAALTADDAFAISVPARPEPGFAEIAQGAWEGLPGAEIAARWPDILAGWRRDPLTTWAPGGESLADVDRRVRTALVEALARLHDRRSGPAGHRSHVLGYGEAPSFEPWSILVGHDGAFKVALLALLDVPLARFWSFPFALCGISVVEFRAGRPRLRAHNLVDHLAPLDDERARAAAEERSRTDAL